MSRRASSSPILSVTLDPDERALLEAAEIDVHERRGVTIPAEDWRGIRGLGRPTRRGDPGAQAARSPDIDLGTVRLSFREEIERYLRKDGRP
jgi:hypothetical protein